MFFEIVGMLLVFAIILLLSYYTSKLVGRKFSGRTGSSRTMKIVETLPLGLDRCLYLILVGKKHFLFYSSKKGMELVSEIEMEERPEDLLQEDNSSANVFSFKKIFETYSGLTSKTPQEQTSPIEEGDNEETSGILGSIKRLRKINRTRNN